MLEPVKARTRLNARATPDGGGGVVVVVVVWGVPTVALHATGRCCCFAGAAGPGVPSLDSYDGWCDCGLCCFGTGAFLLWWPFWCCGPVGWCSGNPNGPVDNNGTDRAWRSDRRLIVLEEPTPLQAIPLWLFCWYPLLPNVVLSVQDLQRRAPDSHPARVKAAVAWALREKETTITVRSLNGDSWQLTYSLIDKASGLPYGKVQLLRDFVRGLDANRSPLLVEHQSLGVDEHQALIDEHGAHPAVRLCYIEDGQLAAASTGIERPLDGGVDQLVESLNLVELHHLGLSAELVLCMVVADVAADALLFADGCCFPQERLDALLEPGFTGVANPTCQFEVLDDSSAFGVCHRTDSGGYPILDPAMRTQQGNREIQDLRERAMLLFNVDPERGVPFLQQHRFLGQSAEEVAEFFFANQGQLLGKVQIGFFIGGMGDYNARVLHLFVERTARAQTADRGNLVASLRHFIGNFEFPGQPFRTDR